MHGNKDKLRTWVRKAVRGVRFNLEILLTLSTIWKLGDYT